MAKLLFKMRYVPEDEAQEVRELLEANDIEYFETFAGSWGISMPALWLQDNTKFAVARELLDHYQAERAVRMKAEYELRRSRGETRTLWRSFIESPLQFVVYTSLIVAVLFFSLRFFLNF